MSHNPIIEARRLTKTYTIANRQVKVLDGVSLSIPEGSFVVVKGSSGSGKTTLLSLLSGLDRPTEGSVFLQNRDITDATEDDLAKIRNATIGFVFQSFHLVPSLTTIENVMFPAELKKDEHPREKAEALLAQVGMTHRRNNYPHQLSGGEKQRTAICRALINRPEIIFADEPTGNLDSENGAAILELLMTFRRERRNTLVLVTHNEEIAAMADRVVVLADGRVVSGADRG
jgi:putative ABC transport system ATP-binding protein